MVILIGGVVLTDISIPWGLCALASFLGYFDRNIISYKTASAVRSVQAHVYKYVG